MLWGLARLMAREPRFIGRMASSAAVYMRAKLSRAASRDRRLGRKMRQRLAIALGSVLLASCAMSVAPDVLTQWQSRQLYTCCNIHYEIRRDHRRELRARLDPAVRQSGDGQGMTGKSVTFRSGATNLTITQSYGKAQEPTQQYFAKILVGTDPHTRLASYSPSVQTAITDGRVEQGMTREQVIMSLGYPPTHRTPSIDAPLWVYWYNRWVTFNVQFGADGLVSMIVGTAPTSNQPVTQTVAPSPKPAPAEKKKR